MVKKPDTRIEVRALEPIPVKQIKSGTDVVLQAAITSKSSLAPGSYVLSIDSPAQLKAIQLPDEIVEDEKFDAAAQTVSFRLTSKVPSLSVAAILGTTGVEGNSVPVKLVLNRIDDECGVGANQTESAASTALAPAIPTAQYAMAFEMEPAKVPGEGLGGTTIMAKESVPTAWTNDLVLSQLIKKSTAELGFNSYRDYMDLLLCSDGSELRDCVARTFRGNGAAPQKPLINRRFLPFNDTDAYRFLKVATEAFVAVKSGVDPATFRRCACEGDGSSLTSDAELERLARSINAVVNLPAGGDFTDQFRREYIRDIDPSNDKPGQPPVKGDGDDVLPYLALIHQKLKDYPLKEQIFANMTGVITEQQDRIQKCIGVLRQKLTCPIMVELIWSYWHEQGMQVQTMFAIRDRFQNRRSGPGPDPLAAMEIGYLRPLNNLLWGYIQDEQHRLTLLRRCYEYDHHYGLTLQGKAVPPLTPADSRARFVEAFHNLLYLCTVFFKEDDDTNRRADAFPVLNAIKEVHFLLSEGAQNQFGDLPTTARIEMLMEQWLLARPEMREFLPSRESIAYPEDWMGPVDAMKAIQGWTNASVMYFHDLAVFGEQILLSIRYNNWSQIFDRTHAANWAKIWRSEIQGYMHAYRTVAGVDLSIEPTEPRLAERRLDPAVLLGRRLDEQRRAGVASRGGMRLPASPSAGIRLPEPRLVERR